MHQEKKENDQRQQKGLIAQLFERLDKKLAEKAWNRKCCGDNSGENQNGPTCCS